MARQHDLSRGGPPHYLHRRRYLKAWLACKLVVEDLYVREVLERTHQRS